MRKVAYKKLKYEIFKSKTFKNMHDEHHEGMDDGMEHMCHMMGPQKKEFKLAMLEKKEKIIEAKLEFIRKMKELVKKSTMDK